ncbi:MAG: hypothetical protein Q4F57_04150 [Weeksellaceae bacterium]|nr:hypothetical protein [Weeksellaceae bacterium]
MVNIFVNLYHANTCANHTKSNSGGVLSGISGGDFGRGFIGGALNNISASLAQVMRSVGNFGVVEQHLAYAGAAAVSAKLQGGNFWLSAGQALTVGLLNHGVSRLEEMSKMYQSLRNDAGIKNPFSSPDINITSVEFLIENVPELTRMRDEINEDPHGMKIIISKRLNIREKLGDGRVIVHDGEALFNSIYLYQTAFRSHFKLALSIGHEMNHVIDNLFYRSNWLNRFAYRRFRSEYNAYKWEYEWGNQAQSLRNMNHYRNKYQAYHR